jgi:capsular polysaccharide biosynthesis protein
MELKRYLQIVRRWAGLVAVGYLVTSATTFWLVSTGTPMYESKGTLLLGPRLPGAVGDAIDASDLLIRGVKIGKTYATIAVSSSIRDRSEDRVDPSIDVSDANVTADVLTDTNILEISVTATDPAAAHALAAAVVDETTDYVADLDDAYVMVPLDEPILPKNTVGSNATLTIVIGMFFGLILGVGLALLAEYLKGDPERDRGVIDSVTGLHNQPYLQKRLREEVSRTGRSGLAFSVAVLRVAMRHEANGGGIWRAPGARDLQKVGKLLQLAGRREMVVSYLDEGEFGAILPHMDPSAAEGTVRQWKAGIAAVLDADRRSGDAVPRITTSICEYRDRRFRGGREAILTLDRLVRGDGSRGARADAPDGPENVGPVIDASEPKVAGGPIDASGSNGSHRPEDAGLPTDASAPEAVGSAPEGQVSVPDVGIEDAVPDVGIEDPLRKLQAVGAAASSKSRSKAQGRPWATKGRTGGANQKR